MKCSLVRFICHHYEFTLNTSILPKKNALKGWELLPSMLLKAQKGLSISIKLRLFFWQASSTRSVRITMTTGVISSNNIRPSGEFAGSAIFARITVNSRCGDLACSHQIRLRGSFEIRRWSPMAQQSSGIRIDRVGGPAHSFGSAVPPTQFYKILHFKESK